MSDPKLETWAIVELMGHVRMAGRITEEEHFGAKLGRIDIPKGDPAGLEFATQFFGGSSVYRITPVTEEAARAVARTNQPQPVHTWELPKLASAGPQAPGPQIRDFFEDSEDELETTEEDEHEQGA